MIRMAKRKSKTKSSKSARRGASQAIRHHKKEGMPQDQAVAVALSEQRRKGRKVGKRKTRGRRHKENRGGSRKAASRASRKAGRKSRGGRSKGQTKRSRAAQKAGRASARARKRS